MESPLFSIERHTPEEWNKFVDEIYELTQAFGYLHGLDKEGAYQLAFSVREAAVNAVKHGNRHNPEKRIKVDFYNCDDRVKVYVSDESDSRFDPLSHFSAVGGNALADHGRGYMIMKGFADSLEYEWLTPGNRAKIEMLKSKTHTSAEVV